VPIAGKRYDETLGSDQDSISSMSADSESCFEDDEEEGKESVLEDGRGRLQPAHIIGKKSV